MRLYVQNQAVNSVFFGPAFFCRCCLCFLGRGGGGGRLVVVVVVVVVVIAGGDDEE